MGWREFWAFHRERVRAINAERGVGATDPNSWRGQEQDGWWAEMREKNRKARGG